MSVVLLPPTVPMVDHRTGKCTDQWYKYFSQIGSVVNNLSPSLNSIKFPSTQVPSTDVNTLDDYEEGTWTPSLTFATPGDLSVSYSSQMGGYTKIGNRVFFGLVLITSSFTYGTAASYLLLDGLPFVTASSFHGAGSVAMRGYTKANFTQLEFSTKTGDNKFYFVAAGSGQTATELLAADVPSGGTITLTASGSYRSTT